MAHIKDACPKCGQPKIKYSLQCRSCANRVKAEQSAQARRRKSQTTIEDRFWSKVIKTDNCWLWTAGRAGSQLYGAFKIDGIQRRAHRVAWELVNGPIPPGLVVLHACDNPICVNPAHLRLGTNAENSADMVAKGRQATGEHSGSRLHLEKRPRGERHHKAKLTEAQVREMRTLAESGVSSPKLAKQFGITKAAVLDIIHRRHWSHIP